MEFRINGGAAHFQRQQLRQGVQLAGELPKSGANLYELLRDEIFAKVRLRENWPINIFDAGILYCLGNSK